MKTNSYNDLYDFEDDDIDSCGSDDKTVKRSHKNRSCSMDDTEDDNQEDDNQSDMTIDVRLPASSAVEPSEPLSSDTPIKHTSSMSQIFNSGPSTAGSLLGPISIPPPAPNNAMETPAADKADAVETKSSSTFESPKALEAPINETERNHKVDNVPPPSPEKSAMDEVSEVSERSSVKSFSSKASKQSEKSKRTEGSKHKGSSSSGHRRGGSSHKHSGGSSHKRGKTKSKEEKLSKSESGKNVRRVGSWKKISNAAKNATKAKTKAPDLTDFFPASDFQPEQKKSTSSSAAAAFLDGGGGGGGMKKSSSAAWKKKAMTNGLLHVPPEQPVKRSSASLKEKAPLSPSQGLTPAEREARKQALRNKWGSMTNGGTDLLVGPPGTSPASAKKPVICPSPTQQLSAAALARHLPNEEDIFPASSSKNSRGVPQVISNEQIMVLDDDEEPMSEEREAELNRIMARLYPTESEKDYQPSSCTSGDDFDDNVSQYSAGGTKKKKKSFFKKRWKKSMNSSHSKEGVSSILRQISSRSLDQEVGDDMSTISGTQSMGRRKGSFFKKKGEKKGVLGRLIGGAGSNSKGDLKNYSDDASSATGSGMPKRRNSFFKKGEKKGIFGKKASKAKPAANKTWKDDSSHRGDPARRPINIEF